MLNLPRTANSHLETWNTHRYSHSGIYTEVEARYIITLPTNKTFNGYREKRQEFYLQAELLIMAYEEIKIVFWQEPEILIKPVGGMTEGYVTVFPLISGR